MRQAKRGLSHVCRIDRVFHRRSNFFAFRRFECREVFSEGVRCKRRKLANLRNAFRTFNVSDAKGYLQIAMLVSEKAKALLMRLHRCLLVVHPRDHWISSADGYRLYWSWNFPCARNGGRDSGPGRVREQQIEPLCLHLSMVKKSERSCGSVGDVIKMWWP